MAEIVRFRRRTGKGAVAPGLSGPLLYGAAFFLGLAVSWLVLSGTAERLLRITERGASAVVEAALPGYAPLRVEAQFTLCREQRGSCVIDGDTLDHDGLRYRITDINSPEVSSPGCAAERQLGERATRRLRDLLNAGPFELVRTERDEDPYGRKLRIVRRDGQSLGQVLVAEGLAHEWRGYKEDWC